MFSFDWNYWWNVIISHKANNEMTKPRYAVSSWYRGFRGADNILSLRMNWNESIISNVLNVTINRNYVYRISSGQFVMFIFKPSQRAKPSLPPTLGRTLATVTGQCMTNPDWILSLNIHVSFALWDWDWTGYVCTYFSGQIRNRENQ